MFAATSTVYLNTTNGVENMSKYNTLWLYVQEHCNPNVTLSFEEIKNIAGVELDHSFLQYKKELTAYGCEVKKISMKNQTVDFEKNV